MKRRAFLVHAGACVLGSQGARGGARARALSGDRFILGDEEFQLADVIAPPLYSLKPDRPAYFEAAMRALQKQLEGELAVEDVAPKTRWGVRTVSVRRRGGGETVQEALVSAGAVRVAPHTDDLAFIDRLMRREAAARRSHEGLWAYDAYKIADALAAGGAVGGYHLIEGVVANANAVRSRCYLNFGADYRTDFTASAAGRLCRLWAKGGLDLAALAGAKIRVRGFVDEINGPSIDLVHQKQIELLAPPRGEGGER